MQSISNVFAGDVTLSDLYHTFYFHATHGVNEMFDLSEHLIDRLKQLNIDFLTEWQPYFQQNSKRVYNKRYVYFITFTLDESKSTATIIDLEKAIRMLPNRIGMQILQMAYVVEHKDTNAHIHTLIETGKTLKQQQLQFFTKHFGFIDYRPVKIGTEAQVMKYMSKENEPFVWYNNDWIPKQKFEDSKMIEEFNKMD